MNLENLNLVELNAQEVQEVEGGLIWFAAAAAYSAACVIGVFALGAYNGYNSASHP